MLWEIIISLLAFSSQQGPNNRIQESSLQEKEFIPLPYGPQTIEEKALAREALEGDDFGGDMILPDDFHESSDGIKNTKYRWPGYPGNPVVPYAFDVSFTKSNKTVLEAMEQIQNKTCVQFVKRTNETDYINIKGGGKKCSSKVGKAGGAQDMNLADGCLVIGTTVHEFCHALGFYHEHQRSDRDDYIDIYEENVKSGKMSQFKKIPAEQETRSTEYDYDSIMHYSNYAFSINDTLPTMVAKNNHTLLAAYEKPGLNDNDVEAIKLLYECE